MGFPGAYGVMFPVVIFRAALTVFVIKETALSVMNLLLGRGWENPSARVLAMSSPADVWHSEAFEDADINDSFEGLDARALAEKIRASLPLVRFGDISDKFANEEEVQCSVCLCNFTGEEEVRQIIRCSHIFHKDCLDRWLGHHQTTCPLCRSSLATEELLEQCRQTTHVDAELASELALWFSYQTSAGGRGHWWQAYLHGLPELFGGLH